MSNENNSGEGSDKKGGEGGLSLEEVTKRLKELESSNDRLVKESKDWKAKYQTVAQEKEETERKKAEESGDLAKQLEIERKEKEKLANDNKSIRGKTLKANIRSEVSKLAKDVHDLDDFLNQPQFAKLLEEGIDTENLTVSRDAAKNYVNAVLAAKPYMKKIVEQAHVDANKPNGKGANNGKDYSKMTSKQIMEDIKNEHS